MPLAGLFAEALCLPSGQGLPRTRTAADGSSLVHRVRAPSWFGSDGELAAGSERSQPAHVHGHSRPRTAAQRTRRERRPAPCDAGAFAFAAAPAAERASTVFMVEPSDFEDWPLLPPIRDTFGMSARKFMSPILPGYEDGELEQLPVCTRCNGSGRVTCGVCKGVGDMRPFSRKPCLSCLGEKETHCYECYGTGRYHVEKPSGVFTPMTDGPPQ